MDHETRAGVVKGEAEEVEADFEPEQTLAETQQQAAPPDP